MTSEADQAEVVEPAELVPVDSPTNLFLTNDPDTFLARASEAAGALARVVRERKLFTRIRGKDHVHVEGWTLLGSLLGVFPITEWTRRIDDGWEARVVAKTRYGELVGAAESMCTPKETRWRTADEYAIRSMAATRATSKALRLPLGFIMVLEGFDATPAEEISDDDLPPATSKAAPVEPSREQITELRELIDRLTELEPGTDWVNRCREIAGVPGDMLTRTGAAILIDELRKLAAELEEADS
jgi:hypothetical protein